MEHKGVTVVTTRITGATLEVGWVVIDEELYHVTQVDHTDHLNVTFKMTDSRGRVHHAMTANDTSFDAVIWPTRLASRSAVVNAAQIARDQMIHA